MKCNITRLLLIFVVVIFSAGCATAQSYHVTRLAIARADTLIGDVDFQFWKKAAFKKIKQEPLERTYTEKDASLDHRWVLPPQEMLPEGGEILDGDVSDNPPCEAERHDRRFIVFRPKNKPVAVIEEGNAYPRHIEIYSLHNSPVLTVIVYGENWRAGWSFGIYHWKPEDGTMVFVWGTGGEEDADVLSYEVLYNNGFEILIHGIRPNKREGYEKWIHDLPGKLGFPVRICYCGEPW